MNKPLQLIILLLCSFLLNIDLLGQVNLQSSNLPIVVIATNGQTIVDEPRITADMGVIWNGDGMTNHISDPYNDYNGKIAIEMRGQTSQQLYDKKSYRLETQDTNGDNFNVNLLGFPKENDWILYGPFGDKSLMRTPLAMMLGRSLGQYASRTKYCELVINGEYQGIYVLMENIKRDDDRVDIASLTPDIIAGDELTGGYILRLDKYDENDEGIWESDYNGSDGVRIVYQLTYPKPKDVNVAQTNYIQDYIADFETALRSEEYQDPNEGYAKYIDVNSFVDYLIMNELTRNPDAYRISTYMHKKRDSNGGKLHAGPIWDFNIGMGNANFCISAFTSGWVLNYNQTCPQDFWLVPYFWDRLLTDPSFTDKVVQRWHELRENELSDATILQKIDSIELLLEEAQQRNFTEYDILNSFVWPNFYIGGTYAAEVQYLRDWFTDRTAWIDANIEFIGSQVKGEFSRTRLTIYPNPVRDKINIDFQGEATSDAVFTIFNTLGQEVNRIELDLDTGFYYTIEIKHPSIQKLRQGLYYFTFQNGNTIVSSGSFLKL